MGRTTADANLLPRDAAPQHEAFASRQRVHLNIVVVSPPRAAVSISTPLRFWCCCWAPSARCIASLASEHCRYPRAVSLFQPIEFETATQARVAVERRDETTTQFQVKGLYFIQQVEEQALPQILAAVRRINPY